MQYPAIPIERNLTDAIYCNRVYLQSEAGEIMILNLFLNCRSAFAASGIEQRLLKTFLCEFELFKRLLLFIVGASTLSEAKGRVEKSDRYRSSKNALKTKLEM